jgi:hypothetical protein
MDPMRRRWGICIMGGGFWNGGLLYSCLSFGLGDVGWMGRVFFVYGEVGISSVIPVGAKVRTGRMDGMQ